MGGDVRQLLQARRYREALEALLDSHEQQVFRMALVMLRDRGRAEEVTQDVLFKLWKALPSYDGRALPSRGCIRLRATPACRPCALSPTGGRSPWTRWMTPRTLIQARTPSCGAC